jgi:hypothetical protein
MDGFDHREDVLQRRAALQAQGLAIEEESLVGSKLEPAKTGPDRGLVDRPSLSTKATLKE